METRRRAPEDLLAIAQAEERKRNKGKLKIFFGAAPGVGKTYAMLEEARDLFSRGADVMIGYVEPHVRTETMCLLIGLDILPPRKVDYREMQLQEFDVDAALQRKPGIIIVDELAHTNVPGSRHTKRYQDILELLDAGIHVYTTLNVQHLESLNDIITQITGVPVRETIPDEVFHNADEIKLIDVPPNILIERLSEGKIYVSDVAVTALRSFFRIGNLTALREIALRKSAEWVNSQMESYRKEHGIAELWPSVERWIVGIDSSANGAKVLRAAKRLSLAMHAELIVIHVETAKRLGASEKERRRLVRNLQLAERLNSEIVVIPGETVAEELIKYAKSRNAGKIVLGQSSRNLLIRRLFGSTIENILRNGPELDILIVNGDGEIDADAGADDPKPSGAPARKNLFGYIFATGVVGAATGISLTMLGLFNLANVAMVYLLGVVIVAAVVGRGASVWASILSVAAFDFFCVPPYHRLAIADSQYLVTFAVMLVVGLSISKLTDKIREQADDARSRERRLAELYTLSRELTSARTYEDVIQMAAGRLRDVFHCGIVFLRPDPKSKILIIDPSDRLAISLDSTEMGAAAWAFENGAPAGLGTATLPAVKSYFVPLVSTRGILGVVGLRPHAESPGHEMPSLNSVQTFVSILSGAIERTQLLTEKQIAETEFETERIRSAVLSSVSHDLRTPLAVILGNASNIHQHAKDTGNAQIQESTQVILDEAERLNNLIHNLIFATRLESKTIELRKDWMNAAEIVGSALLRIRPRLGRRSVTAFVRDDLPLAMADSRLIEQVIVNLIENAARYSPPESPIEISAWVDHLQIVICVEDRGPGLAEGEQARVFDRFFRGRAGVATSGLGLGLYICRGIVQAHNGRIWAENAPAGGARFSFTIPLEVKPNLIEKSE